MTEILMSVSAKASIERGRIAVSMVSFRVDKESGTAKR